MSVLNDVSVQDGLSVRNLCGGICCEDAKDTLMALSKLDAHRMDTATFRLPVTDKVIAASSMANAHWLDEDGNMCWGTPDGSWRDYCKRVANSRDFMRLGGAKYMPTLRRRVSEGLSRDLLLATYVFPFVISPKHEDPCTREFLLPVLKSVASPKVMMGSKAVYNLIVKAWSDEYSDLSCFSRVESKLCKFSDFADFGVAWSVGTSVNCHDMAHAINRSREVDWERADKGKRFLKLAGLSNYLQNWMAKCSRGGRVWKMAEKRAKKRKKKEKIASIAEITGGFVEEVDFDRKATKEFRSRGAYHVGKVKDSSTFRVVGSRNLVLMRLDGDMYLLNDQDLLNLKFAAMSHSMWHLYSGSIKVEYLETDKVVDPLVTGGQTAENVDLQAIAEKLVTDTMNLASSIPGFDPRNLRQEQVSYETVTRNLDSLWNWYMDVVHRGLSTGHQDYIGRYLTQVFSVYTAKQGGDLMEGSLPETVREIVEEYSEYGFDPQWDIDTLMPILLALPDSAVHDFGRLAKIVPGYDVNPIVSFLHRAQKMREPNPRGVARMTGDFSFDVREETDDERSKSLDRLKCAARVMLAQADVRQRVLDDMSGEEVGDAVDDPFPVLLRRLKAMGKQVATAVRYRGVEDLYVPERRRAEARRQALDFVNTGHLPSNEYAGAYLNVSNIASYQERGDPDLAVLRATSIVDGQLAVALSNITGVARATPTRDTDGNRERGAGTMVTDYLLDRFPSRSQALAYIATETPVAATSDKVETDKYPMKTRVITSMCAEGRRIQGEFEHNNGKVLVHVPGYMIGLSPAERLKRTYAAIRQVDNRDRISLFGSLDLSSFSQGMHWDIQHAMNEVLFDAYGLGSDLQDKLESCTIGTYMIRAEANLRLFTVNDTGSNYEGLDGKRNTFMHCAIWYLARCDAARAGVTDPLRAFLYIDDGAFAIQVDKDDLQDTVRHIRESLVRVYTLYGLKISMTKTVLSTSYMQFLNEIFKHGVHIGYGFRALCHTAAQTFPEAASVAEELAVIVGGIRGSGVAGGQSLRLLIGFLYIIWLYAAGVVGNKGRSLQTTNAFLLTVVLFLPTIAGGFGMPNWTSMFSNLSGNRDVEKIDRVKTMSYMVRTYFPEMIDGFRNYVVEAMTKRRRKESGFVPDRVTIAHPGTARFGDLGRDIELAKEALSMAHNAEARVLLQEYIRTGGKVQPGGVTDIIARAFASAPTRLPMVIVEKGLATDSRSAIVTLIKKVSSSYLIGRIMPRKKIRWFNRRYFQVARDVMIKAESYMLN